MLDEITKILQKIGLTETEAKIYVTSLKYDTIGVKELEKKTRIKRTTIYHALDTLMNKGLAAKKGTESKYLFTMTPPDKIHGLIDREIRRLENKNRDLKKILPLLEQQTKKSEAALKISHYEGIEGVKLAVEEALYCRSKHWEIIAPHKNFFSDFNKNYAKYFMKTRRDNKIQARTLWEEEFDKKILSKEEIAQRNPRFLPKVMHGKFGTVIIIFDDKVLTISPLEELSAILIQSEEMRDTFLTLFNGIWAVSKKYEDVIVQKQRDTI
jgi:sugar-specific transcriptional regulator TrmB